MFCIKGNRRDAQPFIALRLAHRCTAVVADNPQHRFGIFCVAREGTDFGGHLCRGGVGDAAYERGKPAAERPAFV